jgi:outer membrane protein TolC
MTVLLLFVAVAIPMMAMSSDTVKEPGSPISVAEAEQVQSTQNVGQVTDQGNETINLSLQEAINTALEKNASLKLAAMEKKKADYAAEAAHDLAKSISADDVQKLGQLDKAQSKYLQEKSKTADLEIAKNNYLSAEQQVKYNVQKAYYSALLTKDRVEVAKRALDRANEQLRIVEISFDAGTVAKTDVLTAQSGQAKAKADLVTAENAKNIALINLNQVLGLAPTTKLNLTTTVDYSPSEKVDINDVIGKSIDTRMDVTQAALKRDVAKVNSEILNKYLQGTASAQQAKIDLDEADLNYEETKKQVTVDLIQAYQNIQAAEETYNYYCMAVDQDNESFRLTTLRYEVGMSTNLEVLSMSVTLSQDETQKVQALYNCQLAKTVFENTKLMALKNMNTAF